MSVLGRGANFRKLHSILASNEPYLIFCHIRHPRPSKINAGTRTNFFNCNEPKGGLWKSSRTLYGMAQGVRIERIHADSVGGLNVLLPRQ